MMMRLIALGLLPCALLSGCCTIISGTSQEIPINSDPTGAKIQLDGKEIGTTPTTLTIPRSTTAHTLLLTKDGFEPKTETLTPGANGWMFLNIPFTLFVGVLVDAIDGAGYKYSPGEVKVPLSQKK